MVSRNVIDAVEAPTPAKPPPKALTAAQAQQILELLAVGRLFALYVLTIAIGAREGELLASTWANWQAEIVYFNKAVQFIPTMNI